MNFGRFRTLFVVASLSVATLLNAGAGRAEDLVDAAKLPRMPGGKELFAFPTSAAFTTSGSVPEAVAAVSTLLVGEGWQPYQPGSASQVATDTLSILQFKKDRQALSVMITIAPAQNNATSVTYTPILNAHDLPFPKSASAIKYDPDRPYLACTVSGDLDAVSEELRKGLTGRGYAPWSAADSKRVQNSDVKSGEMLTAFYVHDRERPLYLTLHAANGATRVTLESISAETLAAAGKAATAPQKPSEPAPQVAAPPAPSTETAAPQEAAKSELDGDVLARQIMNEASEAIKDALSEIDGKSGAKNAAGDNGAKAAKARDAGQNDQTAPLTALDQSGDIVKTPIPVPSVADDLIFDGVDARLEFETDASVRQVVTFYRMTMKAQGWAATRTPIDKDNMAVLRFSKDGKDVDITVMRMGPSVKVSATGEGLEAKPDATANAASISEASLAYTVDQLEAEDVAGFPVPKPHSMSGSEKSMFRISANASVPANIEAVAAFYRRELAKRSDWKEDVARAKVAADMGELYYDTPEGPAKLSLGRNGGETAVTLTLRKRQEASKSGLMPAAGQVKLLFANMLEKDAAVTISKKTVKIGAGKGQNGPDGPSLDLPPGKYTMHLKATGKSANPEEITVGPDEIWGVIVGPGGLLALQMY